MRRNRRVLISLVLIALMTVASSCASTGVGKAVQAADVQKKLVEATAVEFIKLHMRGDPRVDDTVYARGKAEYGKWAKGQQAMGNTLAAWKAVSTAENEGKLSAALTELARLTDAYLAFAGVFVDVNALKKQIGGT